MGGDDVRVYATKVEDGHVWVDLSDTTPEAIEAGILKGLKIAFEKQEFDRICRELTRLHMNGLDPMQGIRKALEWSYDRLEFGFLHGYAVTADWLTLAKSFADKTGGDWEPQLICLSEAMEHMAENALRHPQYPYPETGEFFETGAFVDAVEAEQYDHAIGMVVRGLADGLHWADMHSAFAEAALAHYNDFGHSIIYVYKTKQLLDHLGPDIERFLLPTLARHLCYTTREDLIPEFNGYPPALAALQENPQAEARTSPPPLPFPASLTQAFDWVVEHAPHHAPEAIYDELLTSLARNLVHYNINYDTAYHRPVQDNVGWLNFTHGLTMPTRCETNARIFRTCGRRGCCRWRVLSAVTAAISTHRCRPPSGKWRRRIPTASLTRCTRCYWTMACGCRFFRPTWSKPCRRCRRSCPPRRRRAGTICWRV